MILDRGNEMEVMRRPVRVRLATAEDAPELSILWIRSITELCTADHHGKADLIESWCAGKSAETLRHAVTEPFLHWLVAERSTSGLEGLGLLGPDAVVIALYVHPETTGRGAGSALLEELEQEVIRRGETFVRLESTSAAREFYRRHGYQSSGDPVTRFGGVTAYPMEKRLATVCGS